MVLIYSLLTTAPSALSVSPSWCMSALASLQTSALSSTIQVCCFFLCGHVTREKLERSCLGFWDLLSIRCHPIAGDTLTREQSERQASTQKQWQAHQSMSKQKNTTVSSILTEGRSCLLLSQGVLSDELDFIKTFHHWFLMLAVKRYSTPQRAQSEAVAVWKWMLAENTGQQVFLESGRKIKLKTEVTWPIVALNTP